MGIFSYKGKDYEIDSLSFLSKFEDWDKNFA
jgi:sulfur relay (sulfurtransferase) DsrC/TusE family protein